MSNWPFIVNRPWVPQQPYLFQGTVASNLDPSGTAGEADLRAALSAVGLSLDPGAPVREGGSNFSQGERQLICLARALRVPRPFIVMDEPTSAIDNETDVRVQSVLHRDRGAATVITIAHRLETLGSYDLVIELGQGRVVRQGTPRDFGIT